MTVSNRQRLWGVMSTFPRKVVSDSLMRNSLFIMATTASSSVLGYIYWVIAARTYHDYEVGLVSAVISAMTLTSILTNMGFGSTLVQLLPHRASGHDWSLTFNAALVATSLLGLVGGLVAVAIFALSPQFAIVARDSAYMCAFLASIPLWTASTLLDSTFTAERVSGNTLTKNLIFAVLKIALLVAFIPLHIGGLGIFLSWILGTVIAIGVAFMLIRRLGRDYHFSIRGVGKEMRAMFSSLVGHHFINIGGAAPMYLLPVIVTLRLTAADNAYFYATWMLGSQFAIISVAVAMSLFAEGSHTTANLFKKLRSSYLITLGLLIPAMVLFFLAGRLILGIFGPTYPDRGWPLLMVLTLGAIPDATTSVYISTLRVQKRLRSAAILNISMAIMTLVLAWFWLPTMGIVGVGWAWLISQSVGSIGSIIDFMATRGALMEKPA